MKSFSLSSPLPKSLLSLKQNEPLSSRIFIFLALKTFDFQSRVQKICLLCEGYHFPCTLLCRDNTKLRKPQMAILKKLILLSQLLFFPENITFFDCKMQKIISRIIITRIMNMNGTQSSPQEELSNVSFACSLETCIPCTKILVIL